MPSLISNGVVFAVLRTVKEETCISTWPVAILSLACCLAATWPVTSITYSLRRLSAVAITSELTVSGLMTNCIIPSRSRKSIKIKPPKSRRRLTHPLRVSSCPMCSSRTRPAYMERFIVFLLSKLIFFLLFYHKACQISAFPEIFPEKTVLLFSFFPARSFLLFGLFIV